jgi:hypothetical protein
VDREAKYSSQAGPFEGVPVRRLPMDDFEDEYDEDYADDDESTVPCPYCKREIHEESQRCTHCEHYISAEDAPAGRKPLWIMGGVALSLYIVLRWLTG